MYKVLFVCTGNICRSPTAEAVFRARVEAAGLAGRISCDSAGTHAYHVGEAPDPRTIAAARRRGVEMASLVARKVTPADYADFDVILALDSGHLTLLRQGVPKTAKAEVALYLSHAGVEGKTDVPDPYYKGAEVFEEVLDMAEEASERLLARLRTQWGI